MRFWKCLQRKQGRPEQAVEKGGRGRVPPGQVVSALPKAGPAPPQGPDYKCDICSVPIKKTSGYSFTTGQVATSVRFWRRYFESSKKSGADSDGSGVGLAASFISASLTPWIVCEECVQYVDADHKAARMYAALNKEPPGCGAVDPQVACLPAGYGWSLIYDEWPTSIQVGKNPVIHDAGAGTRCDFCRRILYGDEEFCLLMTEVYKNLLDQGANFVRRPQPSRQADKIPAWIACQTCFKRARAQ
jgi:hypothetical protein